MRQITEEEKTIKMIEAFRVEIVGVIALHGILSAGRGTPDKEAIERAREIAKIWTEEPIVEAL